MGHSPVRVILHLMFCQLQGSCLCVVGARCQDPNYYSHIQINDADRGNMNFGQLEYQKCHNY